jgi:membrane glycosyltransferase
MIMAFAPKIATMIDVFLDKSARRSFGGALFFAGNLLAEALFMMLLAPLVALSHTMFMIQLVIFRRGLSWNSQARESHAVPFRLAFAKLWPHMLFGCTVLGVVALKSPHDFGVALMGTAGMILAAPFAVATASPLIGRLFAKLGIARLPEENETPHALNPLRLPAVELRARAVRPTT